MALSRSKHRDLGLTGYYVGVLIAVHKHVPNDTDSRPHRHHKANQKCYHVRPAGGFESSPKFVLVVVEIIVHLSETPYVQAIATVRKGAPAAAAAMPTFFPVAIIRIGIRMRIGGGTGLDVPFGGCSRVG